MAFPVVEATAKSSVNTAGTSHAVTLPASIASTDLVLILMDIGSTSATLNALTDWGELLDEASANGLKILRYTGAGVPSTPTFTSSASTRSASIAFRISGANKNVTPQIGTTGTGTSATPDPPSVTPTGSVTADYLFIAFAGMAGEEADDDTWGNTPPTNYTPNPPLQKACGTAGTNLGGLILAAYRQLRTGSAEDPGTFGVDVSAAWRSQTIIVHPIFQGSASGSISWAGSATGTRTPKGAPTGSISWAGSATGVTTRSGSATGSISWAGAATGSAPTKGSASGSVSWAGSATGVSVHQGDASGAITWAGSASSTTIRSGSATGAVTWAGDATGATTHTGASTGSITWAGSATGTRVSSGNATGAITWAGSATGESPTAGGANQGSATGSITWAGTATGTARFLGAATGTVSWAGSASGSNAVVPHETGDTTIAAENRDSTVTDASRTYTVPHENRTLEVPAP